METVADIANVADSLEDLVEQADADADAVADDDADADVDECCIFFNFF